MRNLIAYMLIFLAVGSTISAQVGIGTNSPDATAILDIHSTDKGLLPPRMTTAQRNAILSPHNGLMIFNTDSGCPNYFYGNSWYEWCGIISPSGIIGSLDCNNAIITGTLVEGVIATGVSFSVPYTEGNGQYYSGQVVNSTGVIGLTATLEPGVFNIGAGNLMYYITGTPTSSGNAIFSLNIGGQSCSIEISVNEGFICGTSTVNFTYNGTSITYGTVIGANNRCWLDRNLGAEQVATNSTDDAAHGDYFQWGRLDDSHQVITSLTTTTLSNSDVPGHSDFILAPNEPSDWRSPQNPNLWQGLNGINNPCPDGYRLPTIEEWDIERLSWSSYDASGAFNSPLKLTMTGSRSLFTGLMFGVGASGFGAFWSSDLSAHRTKYLRIESNSANLDEGFRAGGVPVRCIQDEILAGSINSLDCEDATLIGNLTEGVDASEVSVDVPYTGGNGLSHNGQVINSAGVTGLTATLEPGVFNIGAGNLMYYITGTPTSSGNAIFSLNIGGQSCMLSISVESFICIPSSVTFSYNGNSVTYGVVASEDYRCWLDRNLGASQVATSSTDASSYGDLFQWGRLNDGHQNRTSQTTTILSNNDVPGHENFITPQALPWDWRSPENNNLWQGVDGINNPCPVGYRLPTIAEWDAERLSWNSNNSEGAFASALKLSMAGRRWRLDGSIGHVGTFGQYWSSSIEGLDAMRLTFGIDEAGIYTHNRAIGMSVRCIKD